MSGQIFGRAELLLGREAMDALAKARVILFGVGGVGSWCAEGLVRSGVGNLTIVDPDVVAPTNVNRQLMATTRTIGRSKVEVLRERLLEINPGASVTARAETYTEETKGEFELNEYDYIIDAIDSLKHKTLLILEASASSATFFCSLGSALKVDPRRIKVAEYWSVRGCPLGAALRKKMNRAKTLPAKPFLCVFDDEVLENKGSLETLEPDLFNKAKTNGSLAHITAIFGMTLAGLVIDDVCEKLDSSRRQENDGQGGTMEPLAALNDNGETTNLGSA